MSLKLYNTRTRAQQPFEPLDPPNVRIYVCGLTPSADAHIGHFRTYLAFDVLRRYLVHLGFNVTYVQNVTDIDDRSIARARETGENWHDIVMGFYTAFKTSWEKLGLLPIEPGNEPFATGYITQIRSMIEELIEKGFAYAAKDGVYYRVARFPAYGKLSNRNIDELKSGARIEVDEFKEDPLDFALWKFAKPGEPSWPSAWGDGRPGWHIECSAMARELLGERFDIHGGGADLIFPHHENEIAQSEPLMHAHSDMTMANFWMHGGLLLYENKKMSKSLGNFEPVAALLQRYDPQAIRLLFLQTGYAKPMNFTEESISAAKISLDRIREGYRKLHALADGEFAREAHASPLGDAVIAALGEDLNTSVALSKVLAAASAVQTLVAHHESPAHALGEFDRLLDLLGLTPSAAWLVAAASAALPDGFLDRLRSEAGVSINGVSPAEAVAQVIGERNEARAAKNWAESDRLRDVLARCGVILKDSKEGTTWTAAE
ncbi:MAG: cysteine--tRNA ligase [Candidatus Eremiobacteraeota bacterium]|nr:cysteine--tRNA ligase [Candidatus Eremiobacteraeota bacterium]